MTPTMDLRFVKRRVGANVVRILQQRFESEMDYTEEQFWRDVPLFNGNEATKDENQKLGD